LAIRPSFSKSYDSSKVTCLTSASPQARIRSSPLPTLCHPISLVVRLTITHRIIISLTCGHA
jgi:hypothetical protein